MFEGDFQEGAEQSTTLAEIDGVASVRSLEMLVQWICLGRIVIGGIVEGIGHDAHSAQKATEAWKLIQKEIFSLILLDIKMPGIHGHQFLRYIRKQGTRGKGAGDIIIFPP